MNGEAVSDACGERGFTLMELLVALTLLAILMTALFGGLRFGTRVWEASGDRLEHGGQTQAVRSFLRQRLEDALPVSAAAATLDRTEVLFRGDRTGIRLASSMPESLGTGVFLLELAIRGRNGDDRMLDLVLRWRPVDAVNADDPGERVVLEGVAGMAIGYFGAADQGAAGWHDRWHDQEVLPELVRIELDFPKGDPRRWLPLIVSPMVDEWYDTRQ